MDCKDRPATSSNGIRIARVPTERARFIIFTMVGIALLLPTTIAQSQVCRPDYIGGLEAEAKLGKAIVGRNKSDLNQCRVWVTLRKGGMYLHSNFITPGYDRATRVFDTPMDLHTRRANIVIDPEHAGNRPSPRSSTSASRDSDS